MALPIIIFLILVIIAIALFIFGASRESLNAGFAFLALSAIIFIITGLFIWTGGLQLDQVATIVDNGSSYSITYTELTATKGSAIWAISNLFVFGGMALIVLSLVLTVRQNRAMRYEEHVAMS